MWELDYKESWAPKNWCFWTVVLDKTLESPLDCKEIQPIHPKGNQSWIFIGRTDAEAETPILRPPDAKSWLIWKDPDAGKDWRQEEKGTTGWDGWMASLTQSTWVWVNSGSWWWTGRPGVLQSMGSQRVGTWLRDWTELKKARQNLHPESNQPKCLLNKNQHFSENEVTQYWKHPVYEPNLFDIAKHTHILCLALSLSLAHPFTHPHSQKICPHWSREKNNQQMLTTR